jgi:hypothetical protein
LINAAGGRDIGGRARDAYYLVAAYVVTVPAVFITRTAEPSADLVAWLKLACILAFAWHAAWLYKGRGARSTALPLAVASGLIWTALFVIIVYQDLTMMPFIFGMVVLSLDDVRRTLIQVLGEHGVGLSYVALLGIAAVAVALTSTILRAVHAGVRRFSANTTFAVACVGLVVYFVAGDVRYAVNELVLYPPAYLDERATIARVRSAPDYSAVAIRSNDSVVIVQLESVTSFAVFEPTADGEHFRARIPQPGLETIVKQGDAVLFPLFWANGTQTHRAWESILCSVSGNLGSPLGNDPARRLGVTCLPSHLARAGYATVFFYSYFDLDFYNFGDFAKMAGFHDIVYGPQLMRDGDRRHRWAYDDCVFYDRAFDYLAKSGLGQRDRLFAYLEVGMHHSPFFNSNKYPEVHPFRTPANALQAYQNSVAEQDHCLLQFWKRFQDLGRDDVHLFILPDHGIYGFPEPDAVFATWMAYVPPKRRAREFKARAVVAPTPSQAQLYPTVLELLGGEVLPTSFAFALRGEPVPSHYSDCQLLTEPSSQRVIIRRPGQRAEFRLRSEQVDPSNGQVQTSDFHTFSARFACQ